MPEIVDEAFSSRGSLTKDWGISVSNSGDVSIGFKVVSNGTLGAILGAWQSGVGHAVSSSGVQYPPDINFSSAWIPNANEKIQSTPSVTVPEGDDSYGLVGANIVEKVATENSSVWVAEFKAEQAVISAQMTLQSVSVDVQLNPLLLAKLGSKSIQDFVTIVPPEESSDTTQAWVWYRKLFLSLSKVQMCVGAVVNKIASWGFIPDEDEKMKEVFPEWDSFKEYAKAVTKAKGAGITHSIYYAPEIRATIRGQYEPCKDFLMNAYIGMISDTALGTETWFSDFYTKPVESAQYKFPSSPITGDKIQPNYLVSGDEFSGNGIQFTRAVIFKGGFWDPALYPQSGV